MKIWAYVVVWNEEKMLPYYLRHYSTFCDRIIVLDNESTDNTVSIALEYPMVEVRTHATRETLSEDTLLGLKEKCIEEARGKADYIIVGDCDEFIVHPNIKQFLSDNPKCPIIYPAGFQMVSNNFPKLKGQIYDEVTSGSPDPWYSKPMILNPNLLKKFSWIEGCHEVSLDSEYDGEIIHPVPVLIRPAGEWDGHPWGKWKMQFEVLDLFNQFPIKMLHFKLMGSEYVKERYTQYANRNSIENKNKGLAMHYENSIADDSIQTQIDEIKKNAVKVKLF